MRCRGFQTPINSAICSRCGRRRQLPDLGWDIVGEDVFAGLGGRAGWRVWVWEVAAFRELLQKLTSAD